MELIVAGCSPSCPNPGGASSGYVVRANATHVLLDCGHGVSGALQEIVSLPYLSGVIISHMHPDHFFDLIPLRYGLEYFDVKDLPLLLPPGGFDVLRRVGQGVGLLDQFFGDHYTVYEYNPVAGVDIGDFHVGFAPTQHFIPGFAMRISSDTERRTLFFSSDTALDEAVIELAQEADLALVEAAQTKYPDSNQPRGHLTGTAAGELAQSASVHRLVLTHYWAPDADRVLEQAAAIFSGPVSLAEPGSRFNV